MRILAWVVLAGVATAQAPSYKPKPAGNLKQLMRGILLPNSDAIFNVARKAPKNEKEWTAIEDSAMALAESGNLISMPGRLRENGQPVPVQRLDWIKKVQALVEAAKACYQAARSKNPDTVTASTDQLVDACDNCHKVYRDKPERKP